MDGWMDLQLNSIVPPDDCLGVQTNDYPTTALQLGQIIDNNRNNCRPNIQDVVC